MPKLIQHENGRWYVHYAEGRRSCRVSTGTNVLVEAKRFLTEWKRLGKKETRASTLTIGDLWEAYEKEHIARKTIDAIRTQRMWTLRLAPFWGDLTVADVTQEVVDDYVSKRLAGKVGPKAGKLSTIWLELTRLRACWAHSVKRKRISADDIPGDIDWPEPPPPRDRWLTREEATRLFTELERRRPDGRMTRAERFCVLALYTGARRAAIQELKWSMIADDFSVIHYGQGVQFSARKKRVSVPVADVLRPLLERMKAEATTDYVLDHPGEVYCAVADAAVKAGLGKVGPHVLRHTAATWMAQADVSLWKVAGVLGNTVAMVEKVYAKHSPGALKRAVDALGRNAPN